MRTGHEEARVLLTVGQLTEEASRFTREFRARHEMTDRLMRENRLFPIAPGAARAPRAP